MRNIPFSPPDLSEREIEAVIQTLRSGWITTGPKTKLFEKNIANYCQAEKAVCLNSASAGLELVLRLFEIGEGDEVITTPYTYAATANAILHTGAKPVFVDIKKGEFNIDAEKIGQAVTRKTKAVLPVDFGGFPCDYDEIHSVLEEKSAFYYPKSGTYQETLTRPLLLADAAHSFGANYQNKGNGSWNKTGTLADFTVFSFHAIKNLTTAEGGTICFNSLPSISAEEVYQKLMLLSLHGQNKDAFTKFQTGTGSWQYDIELAGYKCNMTDLMASIGLIQLERYPEMLEKRKFLYEQYGQRLSQNEYCILPPASPQKRSSYHLYPLRIKGFDEKQRAAFIQNCAEAGISCNVHFIPLPMHTLYQRLGYKMTDYPHAYQMYANEITLPLYSKLSLDDLTYICDHLSKQLLGSKR